MFNTNQSPKHKWIPPLSAYLRLQKYDLTNKVVRTSSHSIGVGSMGSVYTGRLLRHPNGNPEEIIIKHIRGTQADRRKLEQRLSREIAVWIRLKHPNVVPFEGFVRDSPFGDVLPGLVASYIATSLFDYIVGNPDHKRRILSEVAHGLRYLHSNYIIHADIQPTNIRVSAHGTAKLIDFGIARIANVRGFTTTLQLQPRYTAPELLPRDQNVHVSSPTFHSDIFSLAMVILQISQGPDTNGRWEGSRPYNHIRPHYPVEAFLLQYIWNGDRPIKSGYPAISSAIWQLLVRCWNSDPRQRPNIQDVLAAL